MVTLREMKDAVSTYFATLVKSTITISPDGTLVNPGENFGILLTVANAVDNPSQGVQITHVIYHIWVNDATRARLVVPPSSVGTAWPTATPSDVPYSPGMLTNEMYLFPAGSDIPTLNVGETDSIRLSGRAVAVGTPRVFFNIMGTVNLELANRSNGVISAPVPIVD